MTNDTIYKNLDITGADNVMIEIRHDGTVVWISTDYGTKLRICRIKNLKIIDNRISP